MRERFILSVFFFTLSDPLVTGTGAITAFFSKKKTGILLKYGIIWGIV